MRTRTVLVLLLAALLSMQWGVPGHASGEARLSPTQIISRLNAERSANGIPGGIKASADSSGNCRKHDVYMAKNNDLTHYEQSGRPGYTTSGAWAGSHAVISYGFSWAGGNPYQEAPIHFAQLMQPRLAVSGAFDYHGSQAVWGCVITLAGQTRADSKWNTVYTYPGKGATGVAHDYYASEAPFTPNELVGTSDWSGQELFVFANGPMLKAGRGDPYHFHIVGARLSPRGGSPVAIRIADGNTPIPARFGGGTLGAYLGAGAGIVIPVKPLKKTTTYVASVTIKGNGVTVKHTWSFTTRG